MLAILRAMFHLQIEYSDPERVVIVFDIFEETLIFNNNWITVEMFNFQQNSSSKK